MRVVFMGTPDFAVPSLRALAAAHDVLAVYTAPDRPAGRGLHLQPSAVKVAADAMGLDVAQPESFKDVAAVESLTALHPDVLCVAAYGLILPRAALDAPRLGSLNVHASLLPRWRGAAPIERAILAGDDLAGVSIMLMEEGLDTGPFALQVAVPVLEAVAAELRSALAQAGARALLAVLDEMTTGVVSWA
jgi:methionyl-tRNA formyltransferase